MGVMGVLVMMIREVARNVFKSRYRWKYLTQVERECDRSTV